MDVIGNVIPEKIISILYFSYSEGLLPKLDAPKIRNMINESRKKKNRSPKAIMIFHLRGPLKRRS